MKRLLSLLLAAMLLALCAGCSQPDSLTLDLSQGYGKHTKLIHLNASTSEKEQRLRDFYQVLEESDPLDKDFSLFAYYPDYLLELTDNGQTTTAYVDVNGNYIDFYYPTEDGATPQLYRSRISAGDFRKLVHQN
ncbi:MAG: hypothetical protein ACOYJZ_11035 [Acutalibacter sp.]|jgi:hypothetical protein